MHCIVNSADGILGDAFIVQPTTLHILEHAEQLARHDTESLPDIILARKGIRTVLYLSHPCKALAPDDGVQIEIIFGHQLTNGRNGFTDFRIQLLNVRCGIHIRTPARGIVRQRLTQRLHHADVVNDQTVRLSIKDTVCTGDGLH